MVDMAKILRQRIEHYRRLLAQGMSADMARVYLELIARDHAALRALDEKPREQPAGPHHSRER
jgi:hypothetical protein